MFLAVTDLSRSQDRGEPEFFLSHTWGQPVDDFVSLADAYFSTFPDQGMDKIVWLDVLW